MHKFRETYFILPAVLKWGPANGVVYTFAKICVKAHFPDFSHITSFTIQILYLSDAMRPEDDSCMDKEKEMCKRLKFY